MSAGIDLPALLAAIDARLADLAAHPDGPTLGAPPLARSPRSAPMNQPAPIPTIDVTEAERRLREDPDAPLLLDVREANEFAEVRAPGAALVPTSSFMARVDELPADRPLLVVCHIGSRSAAVAGYLIRAGRTDVVNVAGGMDAWERAGLPVRRGPIEPGEGDLPTADVGRAGLVAATAAEDPAEIAPGSAPCGRTPQPIRIRMMKLTVPTPAALR